MTTNIIFEIDQIVCQLEEEYEIERILAKRQRAGTSELEFLVKWKGWPEEDNTWESEATLVDCPDVLAAWRQRDALVGKIDERVNRVPAAKAFQVAFVCLCAVAAHHVVAMQHARTLGGEGLLALRPADVVLVGEGGGVSVY